MGTVAGANEQAEKISNNATKMATVVDFCDDVISHYSYGVYRL